MNKEVLKAKIAEAISSTNTSGNQKLEMILAAVDAYSSVDNGAKPIVMRSVCEPSHHNLDVLHLGCCSKCGGTRFAQTDA